MKKIQLKLEFNEEKMKAIKVCLKEKNKDFDTEIINFLNGLYKKSVPKSLKNYIEIDIKPEEKLTEEKKEEQKESSIPLENNNNKY